MISTSRLRVNSPNAFNIFSFDSFDTITTLVITMLSGLELSVKKVIFLKSIFCEVNVWEKTYSAAVVCISA